MIYSFLSTKHTEYDIKHIQLGAIQILSVPLRENLFPSVVNL